jgi:hypothetical protein
MKAKGTLPKKPARTTPDENDFDALDKWARTLSLDAGRPLNAQERRRERLARSVGRPAKPESAKAKRVMISMSPALIKEAGEYAKITGNTLSGLIAESLARTLRRKVS